jgi:hypothetical protein
LVPVGKPLRVQVAFAGPAASYPDAGGNVIRLPYQSSDPPATADNVEFELEFEPELKFKSELEFKPEFKLKPESESDSEQESEPGPEPKPGPEPRTKPRTESGF